MAPVTAEKPSRRRHIKSRSGCKNCKKRKVKCGEERPRSRNCSRLGSLCDLADDAAVPDAPARHPAVSPPAPTPDHLGGQTTNSCAGLGTLTVLDLELLHHYTTSTGPTLSSDPVTRHYYLVDVPKLGFYHPMCSIPSWRWRRRTWDTCDPSPASTTTPRPRLAMPDHEALREFQNHLEIRTSEEEPARQHLLAAFGDLGSAFSSFDAKEPGHEDKARGIFTWLYRIPDGYIELLRQKNSDALCILAFFASSSTSWSTIGGSRVGGYT
ncbi:uncharacterized protein PG986_011750 [Apiospora aurea]|uniref:Zn(2)-C6 fungal-type domain-containing protein n=1 Tax=Apiospora aurea TaxID=335848 RepID=A0ABR1PYL6_9PEZI